MHQMRGDHMGLGSKHRWARGGWEGGDSHRLTPQNTVPLPKAIFDPPNRAEGKSFRATPSLTLQINRKF